MSDSVNPMGGLVQSARRLVVKVGTRVLTNQTHQLDLSRIDQLVEGISRVLNSGRQVILVTSGAIGAGLGVLRWGSKPKDVAHLQAAAAVGQGRLMHVYAERFARHGIGVAQILLTRDDMSHRQRYANARQTMRVLLEEKILPVVNENDTVAVDEIRFGDNDELSVHVAHLMDAQLLVILTDVDGFERRDGKGKRELVPIVKRITPELESFAGGAGQPTSTGGMASKLQAAKKVTACGIPMILANGTKPGVLTSILLENRLSGTLFLPAGKERIAARKRWLAFTGRPAGAILVDSGAIEALVAKGRSLLASGVRKVDGSFRRGDLVSVCDEKGEEFARGVVNYTQEDLSRIKGLRSEAIESLLGRKAQEVIHRDSLVILKG
ncbi:MAG: glutamate 5-kinase [Candidatus Omnitrophica bacterium]|nr:glutamate 5-kinase [Candidatus Omnitrophota bacterium]